MLHDRDAIAARAVSLLQDGGLTAIDGSWLAMPVQSLCVHGDTPGAVAIAAAVRSALVAEGISVGPFLPLP